jgi:hypothetical protein
MPALQLYNDPGDVSRFILQHFPHLPSCLTTTSPRTLSWVYRKMTEGAQSGFSEFYSATTHSWSARRVPSQIRRAGHHSPAVLCFSFLLRRRVALFAPSLSLLSPESQRWHRYPDSTEPSKYDPHGLPQYAYHWVLRALRSSIPTTMDSIWCQRPLMSPWSPRPAATSTHSTRPTSFGAHASH